MSELQPFQSFIALVEFDQETRSLVREIEEASKRAQQLEDELREVEQQQAKYEAEIKGAQKKIKEVEREIKGRDEEIASKRAQLDTLTDNRQYLALKRELDRLKQESYELENQLLTLWNQLETVEKAYKDQTEQYEEKKKTIHEQQEKHQEHVATLTAQKKEHEQLREQKVVSVPQEWLDLYNHMSLQVSDPVVSVVDQTCGGCFYLIPQHELIRLHKRAILQCKGCYRLLFAKEAMGQRSEDVSGD